MTFIIFLRVFRSVYLQRQQRQRTGYRLTEHNKTNIMKNSIDFSNVREDNNNFKEESIFRVLDFLNKKSKTVKAAKLPKKLTIDDLKELAPNYFTVNITDKKTKVVSQAPRKVFSPNVFLMAIRKQYGTPSK